MIRYRRILLWLAPFLAIASAGGSELAIRIVGDAAGYSGQLIAQAEALICHRDPEMLCEAGPGANLGRRLFIAVGGKGLEQAAALPGEVTILAVFPPQQEDDAALLRHPYGAIQWDMPPARFLNLANLISPHQRATVSFLFSPSTQGRLARYESAGAERGLKIQAARVEREGEVGPAVERLVTANGIFLSLPDPVAQTPATVPPLLLLTYRAGVPVIGYSEAYLRAGAAVALYSTPEQIAQQILDTVLAFRRSGTLPASQMLKYYSVGSNPSVLRSLGISLPPAEELEARLRQMKE